MSCPICAGPEEFKVEEDLSGTSEFMQRHPATTWLCKACFSALMNPYTSPWQLQRVPSTTYPA